MSAHDVWTLLMVASLTCSLLAFLSANEEIAAVAVVLAVCGLALLVIA